MSVINTMLQDLDRRHGRPGGEALPGDAIRSTKAPATGSRRHNVLLVLALLAMTVAAGAWWTRHREVAATSLVAVPLSSAPLVASKAPPAESQIASSAAVAPMPAPPLTTAANAAVPMPTVRHCRQLTGLPPAPRLTPPRPSRSRRRLPRRPPDHRRVLAGPTRSRQRGHLPTPPP
jgi:hypothetical protein